MRSGSLCLHVSDIIVLLLKDRKRFDLSMYSKLHLVSVLLLIWYWSCFSCGEWVSESGDGIDELCGEGSGAES